MKIFVKLCMPIGLLIFALYRSVSHFVEISDVIAIPAFIISVTLMMIGIAYTGWCLGKHKNPYEFNHKKKED